MVTGVKGISVDERTNVAVGHIKWFNRDEGYGFVAFETGPDAFLHVSTLKENQKNAVCSGATVTVSTCPGQGGRPQVKEVIDIDESTAEEPFYDQANPIPDHIRDGAEPVEVYVKWFNPSKGYGFAVPANGSADVFIHASLLKDCGIDNLYPDQRLCVLAIDRSQDPGSRKPGPEATKIVGIDHRTRTSHTLITG